MASLIIDDSKYSLDSLLVNTSKTAKTLLDKFNKGIAKLSGQMNTEVLGNIRKNGITYNIRNKKNAFIFLDFRKGFLSLKFFTGEEEIKGLEKTNWTNRSDHKGSKTFGINDDNTLEKALSYALQAFKIKKKFINHGQAKKDSNKLKKIMKIVETDRESFRFRLEEGIVEGGKISRHINSYKRNLELTAKAILIHGTVCMACGFDFEKVYGKRGSNFIEVHHIKPVSTFDTEVKVYPKDDLIVLCSNCHSMVHRKRDDVLSLKKLKELLFMT